MPYKFIILTVIMILVFVGYIQGFPHEQVNLVLAAALFGRELFEKIKTDRILKSTTFLELKSNQWLGGIAMTGILIYYFSDEPMNAFNISAIVIICLTGLFNSYQNHTLKYSIDERGILNLFNDKLLDSKTITRVNYNSDQLAIDTAKYQNELVIKSTNLIKPTWDELTAELKKLDKNSG